MSVDPVLANVGGVVSLLADLVQVTAVLVAGLWTWQRFIRTREDFPSLDVTAGLEIVGTHASPAGPATLAVVTATVRNAGKVRHTLSTLHFDLRAVCEDDVLVPSETALGQAAFPRKLYDEQRFFPKSWVWSFVEPGATNVYRYSVVIPANARFALVSVKLPLAGDDEFFTSWKIVAVPHKEEPSIMLLSREAREEIIIPADPYELPGTPARWTPTHGPGGIAGIVQGRRVMT